MGEKAVELTVVDRGRVENVERGGLVWYDVLGFSDGALKPYESGS